MRLQKGEDPKILEKIPRFIHFSSPKVELIIFIRTIFLRLVHFDQNPLRNREAKTLRIDNDIDNDIVPG